MQLPNRPTRDPYQEIPVKDYSYVNTQNLPPKKSKLRPSYILAAIVVLIAIAIGAYFLTKSPKSHPTSPKNTSHKAVNSKTTAKSSTPSIPLTQYASQTFNLTLNYPTTWSVSSSSNSFSITSPAMSLTADSGKSVKGKITLSVYNQGQIPAAFGSTSVAVLNSQLVHFSAPTTSQAAQTYISFVQYPATTIKGGLDGIYVSGNNGYVKDQNIPSSDVGQVDPLIIVTFSECQNAACTSLANLTTSSNMWNEQSFQTPILDMIKSFSFS